MEIEKIKVIERKKVNEYHIIYNIEECFGISDISFEKTGGEWGLSGEHYIWNRTLILFIESVLRGLDSGKH